MLVLRRIAALGVGALLSFATVHCSLGQLDSEYAAPAADGETIAGDASTDAVAPTPPRDEVSLELTMVSDFGTGFVVPSVNASGPGTLSVSLPRTSVVDLQPSSTTPLAVRFSGDCTGSTCELAMDRPKRVTIRVSPYNYAFVTSETVQGNFGGAAGGDAICERLAASAGLPGTFRALVSSAGKTARDRLVKSGGWMRVDRRPFSGSRALLESGQVLYPLKIDEKGSESLKDYAWSDTDFGNNGPHPFDCQGWTSNAATGSGSAGAPSGSRSDWYLAVHPYCDFQSHLYCFGDDLDTPLPPVAPNATAPRIFVTKGTVAVDAGIAAFDQLCKTEATSSGKFTPAQASALRALVPPAESTPAAVRLERKPSKTTGTGWVRMDGVAVSESSEAFVDGSFLAPISVTADGEYVLGKHVLTGYQDPFVGVRGPSSGTCAGWTAKTGKIGSGSSGLSTKRAFANEALDCSASPPRSIYCLEP